MLTALGDAEAEGAFNAVHRFADTTGHFSENIVYDDASALEFIGDAASELAQRYLMTEWPDVDDVFPATGADTSKRKHSKNV